jgi:hypothetical protein
VNGGRRVIDLVAQGIPKLLDYQLVALAKYAEQRIGSHLNVLEEKLIRKNTLIEQALVRMGLGGPGTQNQVKEMLIQALEENK